MNYTYSLSLMIGAYLLFETQMDPSKTLFLYFLLLLALLGFIVECCMSQEWLNRYF